MYWEKHTRWQAKQSVLFYWKWVWSWSLSLQEHSWILGSPLANKTVRKAAAGKHASDPSHSEGKARGNSIQHTGTQVSLGAQYCICHHKTTPRFYYLAGTAGETNFWIVLAVEIWGRVPQFWRAVNSKMLPAINFTCQPIHALDFLTEMQLGTSDLTELTSECTLKHKFIHFEVVYFADSSFWMQLLSFQLYKGGDKNSLIKQFRSTYRVNINPYVPISSETVFYPVSEHQVIHSCHKSFQTRSKFPTPFILLTVYVLSSLLFTI